MQEHILNFGELLGLEVIDEINCMVSRNYCLEAQNNVNKQSKNIQGVEFTHSNYQNLEIPKNSIIYCDPPYAVWKSNKSLKV